MLLNVLCYSHKVFHHVKELILSSFSKFCDLLWLCRRICQYSFDSADFTAFSTHILNSAKMANLKANIIFTTVYILLLLLFWY